MQDFGLLIAQYNATLPTLTDAQYTELQTDASGRLIISGRHLEDSAHASGDAGIFMLGVRNDAGTSLAGTDGDYSGFSFDSNGKLWVNAEITVDSGAEKLEDDAHASGDQGNYVLAVRADARPTDSNTSADGDYASFFVNASGELWVKDADTLAQLVTIDGVLDSIKVDTAAMVVDLAAIEVEQLAQGVTLDGILADTANIDSEIQALSHLEDDAHVSGDAGIMSLGIRQDSLSSLVSADGDYAAFKVNATGELYVTDTSVLAQLVTIDSVLDSIKVDTAAMVVDLAAIEAELLDQGTTLDTIEGDTTSIDSTLTALSKTEDEAHVSGDQGVMSLAVRNDADAALTSADGDYSPIAVDSAGRIKTVSSIEGSEEYTVTDALAAAGDGLETITAAATPWVTVASFAHTSGTAFLYGWQWACDQNAQARIVTDDTTDVAVVKTTVNSSAMPGYQEHFGKEGRIEIAGAASLEVKLQIKKRSVPGGNANGTGSLHIRK